MALNLELKKRRALLLGHHQPIELMVKILPSAEPLTQLSFVGQFLQDKLYSLMTKKSFPTDQLKRSSTELHNLSIVLDCSL